jgi:hypothetical protein
MMKATIPTEEHTFDPDGDLVLILSRSPENAANIPISDTLEVGETQAGEEMATASIGDATLDSNAQTQTDENSNDSESSSGFADKQVEFAPMFVSSKHMMVSSPAFRAMLHHGNFKERRDLRTK